VNKLWFAVGRNTTWTKAYDGADDEDITCNSFRCELKHIGFNVASMMQCAILLNYAI